MSKIPFPVHIILFSSQLVIEEKEDNIVLFMYIERQQDHYINKPIQRHQ